MDTTSASGRAAASPQGRIMVNGFEGTRNLISRVFLCDAERLSNENTVRLYESADGKAIDRGPPSGDTYQGFSMFRSWIVNRSCFLAFHQVTGHSVYLLNHRFCQDF